MGWDGMGWDGMGFLPVAVVSGQIAYVDRFCVCACLLSLMVFLVCLFLHTGGIDGFAGFLRQVVPRLDMLPFDCNMSLIKDNV